MVLYDRIFEYCTIRFSTIENECGLIWIEIHKGRVNFLPQSWSPQLVNYDFTSNTLFFWSDTTATSYSFCAATNWRWILFEGSVYFFRKSNDSYICAGYVQVIKLELRTKAMEPFVPLGRHSTSLYNATTDRHWQYTWNKAHSKCTSLLEILKIYTYHVEI